MKIRTIQIGFLDGNLFPRHWKGVYTWASANNFASALYYRVKMAFPQATIEIGHKSGKGDLPLSLQTCVLAAEDACGQTPELRIEKAAVRDQIEVIRQELEREISIWVTSDREKTEIIKPNPDCTACRGRGEVSAGSVPYGSTSVSLPDDFCDCVLDQSEYDAGEIWLDLSGYNPPTDHPPMEEDDQAPSLLPEESPFF